MASLNHYISHICHRPPHTSYPLPRPSSFSTIPPKSVRTIEESVMKSASHSKKRETERKKSQKSDGFIIFAYNLCVCLRQFICMAGCLVARVARVFGLFAIGPGSPLPAPLLISLSLTPIEILGAMRLCPTITIHDTDADMPIDYTPFYAFLFFQRWQKKIENKKNSSSNRPDLNMKCIRPKDRGYPPSTSTASPKSQPTIRRVCVFNSVLFIRCENRPRCY